MNRYIISFLTSLAMSATLSAQTFTFGTPINPQGRSVKVDSNGFLMDGQYAIPVMGEMHYSRVPEKDWKREILKMKAGGITILSTYVFWIHHEYDEGKWDWSGNRNLRKFLETCAEVDMPVVLRVGPFCHGEVYQGGFPVWLVNKAAADPSQFKLRSVAPGFMKATASLFNNIFAQVSGLLWKDGGPVVGMQIENECRGPWTYYDALKKLVLKSGFDLPFYTRTGWPKLNGKEVFGEMLPLYGDYADGFWDRKLTDMPGDYPNAFIMKSTRLSSVIATESLGANQDTKMNASDLSYPYLTCELGGGMMPAYHRRINMSGREVKPLAICKLGSGSNLPGYYMYHGGSNPLNPAHSMGETQASTVTNYNDMPYISYDFQSPLGEMGQPNTVAFNESRVLHQMLQDWGSELCPMAVDSLSEHYARRGSFEFYNDYVRILNEGGKSYVRPVNLKVGDVMVEWADAQPFCKADGKVYFVEIKGMKPKFKINGRVYSPKQNKPFVASGVTFCVLSQAAAYTSYKVDGSLVTTKHGGIIYKADSTVVEEYWEDTDTPVGVEKKQDYKSLRSVSLGTQKVAAMPVEADFASAQVYSISLDKTDVSQLDDKFIRISYKGDVARVYADGVLVEDNFWNGKPMLVRMSDLAGKRVELKILPLGKDYPIYLQKEQKSVLDSAPGGILISLDSVSVVQRKTETVR